MGLITHGLLLFLIVIFGSCGISLATHPSNITFFTRKSFPPDFIFGSSSSAYQYEGATRIDGRGLSTTDHFVHHVKGSISDGSNADVALDFYHRFQSDIKLMKEIGLDAFRLSISWSRIIPTGKLSDGVNPEGIFYYNNLINGLIANGIQPFVTIFHMDYPEALQKEYIGFVNPLIRKHLVDYAEVCFREFGDRVKQWTTINEPWLFSFLGYDLGLIPPLRCSHWLNPNCTGGDSATEPYQVTHNLILAHAEIVKLYRENYKPHQKGEIGIVMNPYWFVPYSDHHDDVKAAQRALDFMFGWFMDPLIFGVYPESMKLRVGDRLPKFTPDERKLITRSMDFVGINYYSSLFAKNIDVNLPVPDEKKSYSTDIQVEQTGIRNGKLIGEKTGAADFYVYPEGLYELLKYTTRQYRHIPIYILECGYAELGNSENEGIAEYKGIADPKRIHFYQDHLLALMSAIEQGANVKGFFAYSFLDAWEWTSGFSTRFGLTYVDYTADLKRHFKHSAIYFQNLLS